MAAPNRIIALNLGMQTVTLAEFRATGDGAVTLHSCRQEELIVDPAADATRSAQIEAAVTNLKKEIGLTAKEPVNFCLPSQSVFTRFVKLPGASPSDVDEIIGFEAQQNVPFPIDEVVWDYQIMGGSKKGMWDVVLVAIKADQLGETNTAVNKGGFKSSIIDQAPLALYNAFRYNYSDQSGCSLLIDIGARTTNLIFIEGDRVFSRSIPVGGSAISTAIAKEFNQEILVGEKLKLEKGFVGLGGAYAQPTDPTDARISKIVRNTMTRLHAEIARSVSFYRQNQSGSAPVRAYLCGGTVGLPYMAEFFSEKLQMPIEHFNPLRNITVANQETATAVGDITHTLGELVGCALRGLGNCPVEINLRPLTVVREHELAKRKPFLIVAAICLLLAPAGWVFYYNQGNRVAEQKLESVNAEVAKLEAVAKNFDALEADRKRLQDLAAPVVLAAADRVAWAEILDELGTKIPNRFIWVTSLEPLSNGRPFFAGGASAETPKGRGAPPRPGAAAAPAGPATIDAVLVRGLYLANPPNDKEARVIDEFINQLNGSEIFNAEERDKSQDVRTTIDGTSWAYEYSFVLPLKKPISLP